MGKNILHLIYCVPKLHFHHAATYEGWTSVSATVATVSWSWVWQILSPQAGSWWWLGLSPTFWIHWRSIAALEALSMLDDITFGWWWTGTNSQSSTSKALTWIQCKLGKQYLVKKFTLPWESNPGPFSNPGRCGNPSSVCWVKKMYEIENLPYLLVSRFQAKSPLITLWRPSRFSTILWNRNRYGIQHNI